MLRPTEAKPVIVLEQKTDCGCGCGCDGVRAPESELVGTEKARATGECDGGPGCDCCR